METIILVVIVLPTSSWGLIILIKNWMKKNQVAKYKWNRLDKKREYYFTIHDFTNVKDEEFKGSNYLLFNVIAVYTHEKVGIIKGRGYELSIPEITFSEAWKIYNPNFKFEDGVIYTVEIKFKITTQKHILITYIKIK